MDAAAAPLLLALAAFQPGPADLEARLEAFSSRIMCYCKTCKWQNGALGDCKCAQAGIYRGEIRTKMAAGMTDEAILAGIKEELRARGEPNPDRVLGVPEKKGALNWFLYASPYLFTVLAVVLVVTLLIWRYLARPGPAGAAAAPAGDIDPALRERLEAEVKRVGWE